MLLLQIEWGADEALEEAPVNRARPTLVPAAKPAGPAARIQPATLAPNRAASIDQAMTLEALAAAITGFAGCGLKDMATNTVLPRGDETTGVLLIGGPPNAEDDRSGQPIMGDDGALLDQMLASIGLARDALLLSPLIPWRPPGGREPSPTEIQTCRPFLIRLIAIAKPARIVLLGPQPARALLDAPPRGRAVGWIDTPIDGAVHTVLILPALAEVMRLPARRKDAWAGMRALRRALDGQTGTPGR